MSTLQQSERRRPWAAVAVFAVLAVGLLVWAKWQPYWVKLPSVAGSHSLGSSILAGRAPAPPAVSVSAGLSFAGTYLLAIWPALVAGLVIAAGVRTLLPPDWVARVFDGGGRGVLRGSAFAAGSMMCTCCAAPVAVGLRERAASTRAALAYWLASPALNPVVLAFCAFILPWPWTVLRALGGLVVVGVATVLGRGASGGDATTPAAPTEDDRPAAVRFLRALGGLAVRLLPEYLLLVVALGALRGVLFPLSSSLVSGGGAVLLAGVVVLAAAGTLLPIPTGAEVAVVAAMLAVGVSGPPAAALLVTLPAVSLPSLLMVRRVFPARLLAAVTVLVVLVGVLTAGAAGGIGL